MVDLYMDEQITLTARLIAVVSADHFANYFVKPEALLLPWKLEVLHVNLTHDAVICD
jgi:hypothetical protein